MTIPYISIAIMSFVILTAAFIVFVRRKEPVKFSIFSSLAFVFIAAGIVFNENSVIGYSLLAVGVILAITNMIIKLRSKK
ncbi:MAG: hypothetical protein ABIE68_02950 [bacterium]